MEYSFGKLAVVALTAFACLFSGCKTDDSVDQSLAEVKTNKSATTYVVTVGMENSKFAGACPGAGIDAKRMTEILHAYSDNVVAFSSETAVKKDVVKAIENAVAKAELFIFFYSGHGGSDKFWDTGADEIDGKDEFYCLYDTYLRDNEMWQLISKSKGRVLLINDCCHSQSIYQVPNFRGITMKKCVPFAATHTATGTLSMQCWSGCPDNTYSYGSSTGGQFTNTLLKYFNPTKTYDYLWEEIERDSNLQRFEEVQRTVMGTGFGAKPIFR